MPEAVRFAKGKVQLREESIRQETCQIRTIIVVKSNEAQKTATVVKTVRSSGC